MVRCKGEVMEGLLGSHRSSSIVLFFLQISFQVVLSTDGNVSFAYFLYKNLNVFSQVPNNYQIGFSAGDGVRKSNIEFNSLKSINIFRIDGMV